MIIFRVMGMMIIEGADHSGDTVRVADPERRSPSSSACSPTPATSACTPRSSPDTNANAGRKPSQRHGWPSINFLAKDDPWDPGRCVYSRQSTRVAIKLESHPA